MIFIDTQKEEFAKLKDIRIFGKDDEEQTFNKDLLVIGLGGIGCKVLTSIKKMISEDVTPEDNINLLYIDSDISAMQATIEDSKEGIGLNALEVMSIYRPNLETILSKGIRNNPVHPNLANWMKSDFPDRSAVPGQLIKDGGSTFAVPLREQIFTGACEHCAVIQKAGRRAVCQMKILQNTAQAVAGNGINNHTEGLIVSGIGDHRTFQHVGKIHMGAIRRVGPGKYLSLLRDSLLVPGIFQNIRCTVNMLPQDSSPAVKTGDLAGERELPVDQQISVCALHQSGGRCSCNQRKRTADLSPLADCGIFAAVGQILRQVVIDAEIIGVLPDLCEKSVEGICRALNGGNLVCLKAVPIEMSEIIIEDPGEACDQNHASEGKIEKHSLSDSTFHAWKPFWSFSLRFRRIAARYEDGVMPKVVENSREK